MLAFHKGQRSGFSALILAGVLVMVPSNEGLTEQRWGLSAEGDIGGAGQPAAQVLTASRSSSYVTENANKPVDTRKLRTKPFTDVDLLGKRTKRA